MDFNKKIYIKNKLIANECSPYIIAEMACAHDGDFEKAKKLIDLAVKAEADAIQLQFFFTDHVVTPNHEVYEVLEEIAFSEEQWTDLFLYAKEQNIAVFVCTYDIPSVSLAQKLKADGIKLNSSDLANPEILEAVAKTGIPFTLGTGASTIEEITNALAIIQENKGNDVILMHGVQNFPTKIEDLNISRVKLLQEIFDLPTGYHDHTEGGTFFSKTVDLIAVGLGAAVIEKHITLDRSEKGIDYQAALEAGEFEDFVKMIRTSSIIYGNKIPKPFSESDLKYRKFQKKSIVAASDIEKGQIITKDKVLFLRNSTNGIMPANLDKILSKKANQKIKKFENILPQNLSE